MSNYLLSVMHNHLFSIYIEINKNFCKNFLPGIESISIMNQQVIYTTKLVLKSNLTRRKKSVKLNKNCTFTIVSCRSYDVRACFIINFSCKDRVCLRALNSCLTCAICLRNKEE